MTTNTEALLREAAQKALSKLRSAQICHPNAVQSLIDEAIDALALQPSPANGGEPVGTVFTMEALGTPGKPFCHVQLNRPLPTGTKLYTHPAQGVPDAWADGVQAAADLLKRMADEMATERGETDPDTGAIQFKSAATREWHASLYELAEEIERLKPANHAVAAAQKGGHAPD